MIILPSIDLMNGKVVRLIRGSPSNMIVYSNNPLYIAERFLNCGVKMIHVVDLDAALGTGSNKDVILDLALRGIPLQVGGGVRSLNVIRELLDSGVKRVVLGTLALKDEKLLHKILKVIDRDRIAVSIDFKGSKVLVDGWKETYDIEPLSLALKLERIGVKWYVYTSIERDGTLLGVNLDFYRKVRSSIKGFIIAAGGISKISDIIALKEIGIDGVIIGRALYEGALNLKHVVEVVKDDTS